MPKLLAPIVSIFLFSFGIATTAIVVTNPLNTPPAQAAWTDYLPSVGGIYINAGGKEFFYGSYTETGVPVFGGSVWEVKGADGRVLAHGQGQTPGWVWGFVQRFFGG